MLALLIALGLWAVEAQAQTPDVCRGGAPAAGAAISCTEASSSTTDITINAGGVVIETTAANAHAVYGKHDGTADIEIDVHTSSDIDTAGDNAYGVYGYHTGTGNVDEGTADIDIDVHTSTSIRRAITPTASTAIIRARATST